MKKKFLQIGAMALLLWGCSSSNTNKDKELVSDFSTPKIDRQVDAIMQNMSLEEKLAQIEGIRPHDVMEDGKFSIEKCREVIPHGIGHFCQFSSGLTMSPNELRDFVRQVQHYLTTETKAKIPAIFHEEAITGFATQGATTFPQQIGMGCSWDEELIKKNTASTAKLMRSAGGTFALSPMLDISRTAHWGRIEESYGEDNYLTSALGLAFVTGLQGDDLRTGVAATTKHFAGYGTQNGNEKELYEEYLMPHEVVIKKGGVKSVMPSYGKYKGESVVTSHEMLTEMLREQVGFNGLVVSDYGAVNLTYRGHKLAPSQMMAGVMALKAGTDIELSKPICFPMLPKALEEGAIDMATIDQAVRRSLVMKARLGLLDEDATFGVDGELDFDPKENRQLAYQSACESIVMLKNNGILPLNPEYQKLALFGPNAATVHGLLGDYTYQSMISFWWSKRFDANNPKLVTLKEGLEKSLPKNTTIWHERGCDWSAPLESVVKPGLGDDRLSKVKMMAIEGLPQPNVKYALDVAKTSDVIVAAVGENIYLCGEGRERKGIKLPGEQEEFVEKLIATGKPVVLVVFGGRPQVVAKFEERCAAILQAWFPGEEGGNAIADIITGKVNPSAKLCITYPNSESRKEMNYKNGYKTKPQYPFGYGLSYTQYAYSDLEVDKKAELTDDRFYAEFTLKNTGNRKGTEIVQLYISPANHDSSMKPIQLKGFKRVTLGKKESKKVRFGISPQQLAQYNKGEWVVNPGKYVIKVGASSTDIRCSQTVNLTGERLILPRGREVFFSTSEELALH